MQNVCLEIHEKGLRDTFPYPIGKKPESRATNRTLRVLGEGDKDTTEELTERFCQHLLEDGKSSKTIESYGGDMKVFLSYIKNMGVKTRGRF